jgi:hypothetical protein
MKARADEILEMMEQLLDQSNLVMSVRGGWGWYKLTDQAEADRVSKMMSNSIGAFLKHGNQDLYVLYDNNEAPLAAIAVTGKTVTQARARRNKTIQSLEPRAQDAVMDFFDKMGFVYKDEDEGEWYEPGQRK